MPRPFVIAHLSDLHVSTFGETFHNLRRIVARSTRPTTRVGRVVWEEAGWRVVADGTDRYVLLDPFDYRHAIPSSGRGRHADPIARGVARARALGQVMAASLARAAPEPNALAAALRAQPDNTNLRFLSFAHRLPADLDAVILTGDLTDDGDGYELVEAALDPWKRRGRLLAIPGNHDLYRFPFSSSARPKPTRIGKQSAWTAFAARLGLAPDETGVWVNELADARTIIVGLNSCAGKQPRLFRHNGAIGQVQLNALRRIAAGTAWTSARHRVVLFHHHLVRLGTKVTRTKREFGMRLDDAETVAETLNDIGATLVLHGHRHISEVRRPVGCHFDVVSAPSFTLGCASGAGPSYWRIELGERAHFDRVPIGLPANE